MPPALASSVYYPTYDLIDTVKAAEEHRIKSVQLYINDKLFKEEYFCQIVELINNSNLQNIVIHLPNFSNLNEQLLSATQALVSSIPNKKFIGLIHFEESIAINSSGLNTTRPLLSYDIPKIEGLPIGIENSQTGVPNKKHVLRAFNFARSLDLPFVFDIGRIMYPKLNQTINDSTQNEILSFIAGIILLLDPQKDILHVTGKTAWGKFKNYGCALGAEGDITAPLIPIIRNFSEQGGIIVLEHEDLQQAIDSLKVFTE